MKRILLNKIIYDIQDTDAQNSFIRDCETAVSHRLFKYSEGSYPFSDSLYISDTHEKCALFKEYGYPVAALSHKNNTGQDFDGLRYIIIDPELISLEDYDNIYRRLCGLPLDILKTERIFIRESTIEDLDSFYELYDDPEVKLFMEPLFEPEKEKEYQLSYIENIYRLYDIGMWTLINNEDDHILGRAGIEYVDAPGTVELGFMIGAPYRRKGYAFEACMAIINYARSIEGINRIRTRVRKDNTASQNLCKKLMFLPVKELDNDLIEWELMI
ncbi:MAG: GNAT family N-acetyltransferase [Lachnospiraceae bacterium]|nr:GNAT family N-acetyltransferase [Lachnospiraceae bacterium]